MKCGMNTPFRSSEFVNGVFQSMAHAPSCNNTCSAAPHPCLATPETFRCSDVDFQDTYAEYLLLQFLDSNHCIADALSVAAVLVLSNGAQSPGPRLLYSFGSCLVVITHYCFERAKRLPYPFGPTIKQVDGTMNTWLHPFIGTLEQQSLCLLSFADDQIYALGSAVENYAPATSATLYKIRDLQGKFEEALSLVHYSLDRKGFIGVSTDLWIRYEEALKERAQRAVNVANRIPLLNLITPLFCAITVPFAEKISDWLVKHSEVKVKSIQAEGEVQREVHEIAAHDLQSTSEIVTEEFLQKDSALSKAEFDEEFERKSTAEEAVETFYFEKEDTTMPDVLVEMIDSGWLLGSSASFIKRNPTLATRSSMSRSSSSRSEGPSCL